MAPVELRRKQLTDEVADHLRNRIMTGALRPGDFVRLDDVASTLGCSVTPVREALVTLRGEGLVRSSPHRGFIVEELSRGDLHGIFWMQAELSCHLAVQAATHPELAERLPVLRTIVDRLDKAVKSRDLPAILAAEFAFHREVNLMGESKKVAWFLYAASKQTPYEIYARDAEWGRQAVKSHRRLITQLRRSDIAKIREEIHTQFADARDRHIRQLESIDFWGESDSQSSPA